MHMQFFQAEKKIDYYNIQKECSNYLQLSLKLQPGKKTNFLQVESLIILVLQRTRKLSLVWGKMHLKDSEQLKYFQLEPPKRTYIVALKEELQIYSKWILLVVHNMYVFTYISLISKLKNQNHIYCIIINIDRLYWLHSINFHFINFETEKVQKYWLF